MDEELGGDVYRMNHGKRGLCVIIDNRDFDEKLTDMENRVGSKIDAANLYKLFTELGFDVQLNENKKATEMVKLLHEVAKQDHTNNDCFVCAILSHGDNGIVYGIDGSVLKIDIIAGLFGGNISPTLAGKPKFFIIQACRGKELDSGIEVADAIVQTEQKFYRIPEMADFLYAYSTIPGYYSWRNQSKGSWFIQALCEVLKRNYRNKTEQNILELLTQVNRIVAYEYESNTPSCEEMNRKKQIPSIVSMLTKRLCL